MPDFPNDPASSNTSPLDSANESNSDFIKRTSTTVGELRKTHGAHFASGYQDSDKIGTVLANAGVNSVDDLLKLSKDR